MAQTSLCTLNIFNFGDWGQETKEGDRQKRGTKNGWNTKSKNKMARS